MTRRVADVTVDGDHLPLLLLPHVHLHASRSQEIKSETRHPRTESPDTRPFASLDHNNSGSTGLLRQMRLPLSLPDLRLTTAVPLSFSQQQLNITEAFILYTFRRHLLPRLPAAVNQSQLRSPSRVVESQGASRETSEGKRRGVVTAPPASESAGVLSSLFADHPFHPLSPPAVTRDSISKRTDCSAARSRELW